MFRCSLVYQTLEKLCRLAKSSLRREPINTTHAAREMTPSLRVNEIIVSSNGKADPANRHPMHV